MPRWRPAGSSLRLALVAAAVLWPVLLVAAPFLASQPHASLPATALLVGVYGVASRVCHQLPQRSFHLWGAQMPVCARCVGIYGGAALAAMVAAVRPARRRQSAGPWRLPQGLNPSLVALLLASAPTAATLGYEWATGRMPSHAIRAAAGLPLGVVVSWLVVAAADNQVN